MYQMFLNKLKSKRNYNVIQKRSQIYNDYVVFQGATLKKVKPNLVILVDQDGKKHILTGGAICIDEI